MIDEEIQKDLSKNLCVLPFIHRHLDTSGKYRVCCMSHHQFDNLDLTLLQKKMLNGEYLIECSGCFDREALGVQSSRQQSNLIFYEDYQKILNHEPTDFSYFDTREPICNMSCRTCNSDSSSAFAAIESKVLKTPIINSAFNCSARAKELNDVIKRTIKDRTIKKLYWAGGEPLISKNHWEIMSLLLEHKLTNISISYNTNLSVRKFKSIFIPKFLSKFKNLNIAVSVDGTDNVYEFLRPGFEFQQISENIKIYQDYIGQENISISSVISIPVLFRLEKLIEYIESSFHVNTNVHGHIFMDTWKCLLNPLYLPKNLLHDLIDSKLSFLSKFGDKYDQIRSVLNYYKLAEISFSLEELNSIKKTEMLFDQHYNKTTNDFFAALDPGLNKWYQSI